MAQTLRPASMTEKIRRTVKIWGDRQVFTIRYINQLLAGLEPYRPGNALAAPDHYESDEGGTFSPPTTMNNDDENKQQSSSQGDFTPASMATNSSNTGGPNEDDNDATSSKHGEEDDDDDDFLDILEGRNRGDDDHHGADDEDDLFADESERQKLDIEINVEGIREAAEAAAAASAPPTRTTSHGKRRRSSAGSNSSATRKNKPKVLSVTNLLDVWNQLDDNTQRFELALQRLQRIESHLTGPDNELENLVGDALQNAVRQNDADRKNLVSLRREIHEIARERKALEQEALRYLPWLESASTHDQEELDFAEALEMRIVQFQPFHAILQSTRNQIQEEEREKAIAAAEAERKRKEAEEIEKFRQAALAKETEAKPGMVWNPTTREYQALNTDESWRD
jgi:hypothetical protein